MKEGWEIKKLNDVCTINYGTRVVQKRDGGSTYPVYGGGGATFKMDKYNREDCLIISRFAMSPKCVRFVQGKFFLNDSGLSVESSLPMLSQEFLDKHLTALNDKIYSLGKGAAQRNLDINAFKNIDIHIPISTAEQEKIVAELNCLSGIIEKKKQQLKEYDALAQSIFYEMFGEDEGKNNGWTTCQVGDVYKFQYGKGNKIPENKGEYPCYGSNGQVGFHVEYNAEDSPIIGHIGAYAGIVIWASGKHYVTYNGVICNLINKDFDPIYAYHMLKSQNYMEKARGGAAQPFVSYDVLREPIIYVPPLALQQEFASKIEAIEKQKELIKKSIEEVETLFNSRMDYYFN